MDAPPTPPLLSAAARYGVSPALFHPLSGGHTAQVYDFPYRGRFGVLRILKPGLDIDLASMQAVQAWLAYLALCGGPVSPPIPSQNGRTLEQVQVGEQVYLVEAGEMAPGVLAERLLQEQWSEALFQSLGRAVGLYHRIAQHYQPRSPELRRPVWRENLNCFNPSAEELAQASPAVRAKREQALALLENLPRDEESWGLAHLDLHFGNFYVDAEKDKITLLDFDDCAYGWYIMDIAMLLFDVLVVYDGQEDRQAFARRFLDHLLAGYRTMKSLEPFWLGQLPAFLKLLEISIFVELGEEWDPATSGYWPRKFMPGRKERILGDVPYLENFHF